MNRKFYCILFNILNYHMNNKGKKMNLKNCNILITGAGSGIGLGAVKLLHDAGANLVICGRNADKLQKGASSIVPTLERITVIACDTSNPQQVAKLVAETKAKLKSIDILVHCVGVNINQRTFEQLNPKSWRELLDGNLDSAFYTIHETVRHMRENKKGLVIVINSISGLRANPLGGSGYNAGKFGLHGLITTIAAEEAKNGIRFCSIFPGEVNTPILDVRPNPVSEEHRQAILQPEDVASTIKFVAELPDHVVIPELVIIPSRGTFI